MKKVKVTELPLYNSLKGLYTLGVDKDNRSVHVSLEFLETETKTAVTNAEIATKAAYEARDKTEAATREANKATEQSKSVTTTCAQATKDSIAQTGDCLAATTAATEATKLTEAATEAAKTATTNANDATVTANNAGSKVLKDSAAAIKDVQGKTAAAIKQAELEVAADILKNDTATDTAIKATQTATEKAVTAAGAATQEATQVTAEVKDAITRLIPTGMSVDAPIHLTLGNVSPNYIKARLQPENTIHNVIYISDNRAVDVDPEGRVTIVAKGTSRVHVIPTCNTKLAQTISIVVTEPTMRMGDRHGQMRFTSTGAIRFN